MESKGNIYSYARDSVMRDWSQRVSGNASGIALVAFTTPLEPAAADALQKSFAALGLGADACTFANLDGLSPDETFDILEGIDPIALVAADTQAAQLCAKAARQAFPPMRKMRLFGREARAFDNLNGMFGSAEDKQAVWRLLKTLLG